MWGKRQTGPRGELGVIWGLMSYVSKIDRRSLECKKGWVCRVRLAYSPTAMSSFFPSYNVAQMDFADDDLVGLVSNERSTNDKHAHTNSSRTHNIFDISAPPYTAPPYHFSPHFNSTIPPLGTQYGNEHTDSRSRSRSRPPSVGPTRSATTRGRRTNSISSTSPPPQSRPNPSHIIIPTRPGPSPSPSSALSTGWYIPPTPDSLGNPHSLPYPHYDDHQQQHQGMVSASFPNFSPASAFTPPPSSNANSQDKQALLANEKRRRRRESHNAVERRRRDNINEKITELATLIPECLLEGAGTNGNGTSAASPPAPDDLWGSLLKEDESPPPVGVADVVANGATGNGAVIKANKGMILSKSVEYIRFLQQLVTTQGARNRELENELRGLRGEPPAPAYTFPTNGSPLGDVDEEEEHEEDPVVKKEEETERGRRRVRQGVGEGMDVDGV